MMFLHRILFKTFCTSSAWLGTPGGFSCIFATFACRPSTSFRTGFSFIGTSLVFFIEAARTPFMLHGSPFAIPVGCGLSSIVGMEAGKEKTIKMPFHYAVVVYVMNHELHRQKHVCICTPSSENCYLHVPTPCAFIIVVVVVVCCSLLLEQQFKVHHHHRQAI